MSELTSIIEDAYVLCLCEGGAEMAIMNMLLDEERLIFERKDLVSENIYPRMSARDVEKKFLNRKYERPVVVLRIIDSKRENFKLGKAYFERFKVETCLTKPEIEILIILDADMLEEFYKVKSTIKPSIFCKTRLNHKDVKSKDFMRDYFDIERLLLALKKYKEVSKKDHYTLFELLKS